jgi:hypothetical protein
MRSLMMDVDEYYALLIVLHNLVSNRWLIYKRISPVELVLKP